MYTIYQRVTPILPTQPDCPPVPCSPANFLDNTAGCTLCAEGSWSEGGLSNSCIPCPKAKTVEAGKGTCEGDCKWCEFYILY